MTARARRRWWIRLLRWTGIVVAVLVLLLVGIAVSLRSAGVRRAILARVAGYLEREVGVAVTAEDFSADFGNGRFDLSGVTVGAPGQRPVASVERVRTEVALRSLFGNAPILHSVEVVRPTIDLAAPFPTLRERPAAKGGGAVTVERFTVVDAEVVGPPPEDPLAQWVSAWTARGIHLEGSYRKETLEAKIAAAHAVVSRPGFAPLELAAQGRLSWKDGEPLRFSGVEVKGDGVSITAAGHAGLSGSPLKVEFQAEVEPYLLVAGTPRGGTLVAGGRLARPEETGRVTVAAQAVPAEVLRPFLDAETFTDLSLPGTVFDAEVTAALGPGSLAAVAGSGEMTWRKGRQPMARSEIEVAAGAGGVRVALDGSLLPRSPGRRAVAATVTAASWSELPAGRIAGGTLDLRLPDLPTAYSEVRSLWPRLVPTVPDGVPLQGELAANARFSGALRSPYASLAARWVPAVGSVARLTAEGRPLAQSGTASLGLEEVPLTLARAVAGEVAGTVSGTVDVETAGRGFRTSARLSAKELSHPQATVRTASLSADGTLTLSPLVFAGTVGVTGEDLFSSANASGPVRLAGFDLVADGTLGLDPPRFAGQASGLGQGLELAGTLCGDRFDLFAQGTLAAELQEIAGTASLSADRLVLVELGEEVRGLTVEVGTAGDRIHLTRLSAVLPPDRRVELAGEVSREPFLGAATLRAALDRPVAGVERAELWATLRDGVVSLTTTEVETATGSVDLEATVPLGALDAVPGLGEVMASWPAKRAPGPVSVALSVPAFDSQPLLAALGGPERPERLTGSLRATLTLDPAAPAAGQGELVLDALAVSTPDGTVEGVGALTVRLTDGRLELQPSRLRLTGAGLAPTEIEAQGVAQLDRGWNPFTDAPDAVLQSLEARAAGTVEASLLNPYLVGGSAEGPLALAAQASGTVETLAASVRVSGAEAAFIWPTPYVTRVAAPEAELAWRDGRLVIEKGQARVNGGTVSLSGGRGKDGTVDVEADFAGLRYRLDYGLATQLGGRLRFTLPPEGRSLLAGRLAIDRGVLDRDVNLDREVLELLFAPPATPGTVETFLDTVDLDISVTTGDGVRIRNNIGNLRASWEPLEVSGTLAGPVIRGRVDLDPGGVFEAYGQTLRIDQGALVFTGDPLTDPRLELSATSSLEDRSIADLPGMAEDPLAVFEVLESEKERTDRPELGPQKADLGEAVTSGLSSYYSGRALATLTQALGVSGLSFRPVFVYGEADPSARLTVGKDLSQAVSVAVSQDLRNAEDRLYLLDLHSLPRVQRLTAQAFSKANGERGGSLQQVLELGGRKVSGPTGPKLAELTLDAPRELSARRLRRAARSAGLRRGTVVPGAFEVEVDLGSALLRRGYPDAEVTMTTRPSAERPGRLDAEVEVEPGPHVSFAFAGGRIPRAARDEITGLYRTDFYEPTSLAEMKNAAVRSFRRHGHLDPDVEIEVVRVDPGDPVSARTVTVRSVAGPRVKIQRMSVAGLSEEDSVAVAGRFPGTLARVELAAGLADADRRLLDALRTLGWPEARVVGHGVADRGRHLIVRVEPGPRQHLGTVRITGVEAEERGRLTGLLLVAAGDPARYPLVARGAAAIEEDLHGRGFAEARVRTVQVAAADPLAVDVTYEVSPGPRFQVAEVDFEGERFSREGNLEKVAGLEPGSVFSAAEVSRARTRLFGTGTFSRVTADVARDPARGEARIAFSLFERPRFRLGYGVRWSSDEGTAAVLDFVDQNFLRRGLVFGTRVLYEPDDRSGRLYLQARQVLGSPYSLESFLLARRRVTDEIFIEDIREAALQVSRPFGERIDGRLYARYSHSRLFEEEPDPFFPIDIEIANPHLGTQWIYDSRDDAVDPRRGLLASADLSGSGTFLGGDFEYARMFAQLSAHRAVAVGGKALAWAGAVRVGLARPFGGQELLRFERFFTGGELSVRGYANDSLGPQEVLGDLVRPLGGEALLIVNQELRVRLPFDLTGLVFFDAGQVWDDPADFGSGLAKSLGLGLRAGTPLGLVRFDAALPLDRRPGDERYRLYLGLGNAF